jgi:predicted AAA+ superfamily ATPase
MLPDIENRKAHCVKDNSGERPMTDDTNSAILNELRRLADAVDRLAGPPPAVNDWNAADCFVWSPARQYLQPVARPNRVALALIRGVDHVRDILHENTVRFADGYPANNVLSGVRAAWASHRW